MIYINKLLLMKNKINQTVKIKIIKIIKKMNK